LTDAAIPGVEVPLVTVFAYQRVDRWVLIFCIFNETKAVENPAELML
jgi:hypothetical protein